MAMKKGGKFGKKVKKTKKKKSGGKKDEWTLDSYREKTVEEPIMSSGPRRTQARDDKMRSIRRRIHENREKRSFKDKMGHKISFSDVVKEEEQDEANDESIEDFQMKEDINKAKGIKKVSSFSPFERMRFKLDQQHARKIADQEEDDEDLENEDEEEEDHEDGDNSDNENDDEIDGSDMEEEADEEGSDMDAEDMQSEKDSADEAQDENSMISDDDADHADANDVSDFSKFYFSKASEESLDSTATELPFTKEASLSLCNEHYDILSSSNIKSLSSDKRSIKCYANIQNLPKSFKSRGATEVNEFTSALFPYLSRFQDVLMDGRDHLNDKLVLDSVLLHCCVHTLTSRARVLKHNQRIKEKMNQHTMKMALQDSTSSKEKKSKKNKKSSLQPDITEDLHIDEEANQDQGFCRPRVLILCPYRGSAYEIVESIIKILGENTTVSNLDKFDEEFGPPEDSDEEDNVMNSKAKSGSKSGKKEKKKRDLPEDWKHVFEGKNMDDDFKLGIQVNVGKGKGIGSDKGSQLRLFSDFYISDILIASPLGLRLLVERSISVNDGADTAKRSKEVIEADFLSSLEVIYTHQMDVLYMQNFDHLHYIMSLTNKMPIKNRETDFSRVRSYFLDGNSSKHRQLIVSSSFIEPDIKSFFRDFATSLSGKVRVKKNWKDGSIIQVTNRVQQVFQRFSCSSIGSFREARFKYFKENILDTILRLNRDKTLIITPSYFDFVKLRSHLLSADANACFLSEYSENSEISRSRTQFFNGQKSIMLYSGRLHFFRRLKIRGALSVIFYSPPEYAHHYSEIINSLNESSGAESSFSDKASSILLFSKFDALSLDRIVGAERSKHLITSEKSTFMFK